MMRHKVNAFTIMETIVTMMLSAILVAMIYLIYSVVGGAYMQFKLKNDELHYISRVDELLKKDFASARLIYTDQDRLFFIRMADTIIYKMDTNYIARSMAGVTDSFKVTTTAASSYFEQHAIANYAEKRQLMDELQLRLVYKQDTLTYDYHASYSALDLLNKDIHGLD